MRFYENRLLKYHKISYLILFQKLGKMSQNELSAQILGGDLWVKRSHYHKQSLFHVLKFPSRPLLMTFFVMIKD